MSELMIMNLQGSETPIEETILETLQLSLRGEMLRRGDAGYDEARKVWNAMIDKRPGLIIRCGGAADVIDAVRFAHDHQLLVSVKGNGHNSAGNAVCDGGLMIDLSLMKGIRVDLKAGTVRADAGCNWGDVDRETQAFGMITPGGVVSETGIAGLTLGGGLSWMRRKYGMTIDNLCSVDIVTADGRFLTASATENEDLFWAIRGGGGNFGIVTSFEYKMYALGPEVMFAAVMYPIDQIKEVLTYWRSFIATAPDEITSDAIIWTVPEFEMFPAELHGKPFIMLAGLYTGSVEEGQKMLQPLREAATPMLDLSGVYPYTAVQQMFDPMLPKHVLQCYWKSTYLNSLSNAVIDQISERATNRPYHKVLLSIRSLGGALGRIEAQSTAFGDRSAPFLLSIDAIWDDPADTDRCIAWARQFWDEMQRYSNGMTYFNFPGLLEEGDQMMRDSFGGNYDRLVELKNKYDSANQFRLNQNIQPSVQT